MSAASLPGAGGIDLLRRIREISNVPVILFSEDGDIRTAVTAIRSGAHDYLALPADRDRLLENASALAHCPGSEGESGRKHRDIIGGSAIAQRLRDRVHALAPLHVPVLVSGEPGSGRDHVVRCLHARSSTAAVELTTLSTRTPGIARRPGPNVAVYLDEIGHFKSSEQAHWFEFLCAEEGARPGRSPRVYASTSEDLDQRVREGVFHPGLAERLRRFEVPIAPLRDRPEDIGSIALHLGERLGRSMGRPRIRFERSAIAILRSAPWVGNIRELENVVEKLVAFSLEGRITRVHVREILGEAPDSVASLRLQRSQRQREELVGLLEVCGGNLAEVARRLEISRGAVIYRAQKYGLLPRSRMGRSARRKRWVRGDRETR
jgi:DNA-binding NtrC family response regulator